ncbi:hypothetical protein A0H81_03785 [Grifola frondosa]|uniref:Uncharacterized protein n=1 Tax=Grifola frondosa TaxID=5627 RepID=A0A1C7MHN3_GRIFR|nr:hypothetical protein A0H81_03785 [Grifola frondosa]
MTDHHAPCFLDGLSTYLRNNGSLYIPHAFDSFDIYSRLSLQLPPIPAAGARHSKDVVRATPPIAAHGRRSAQPAHLDFAFIRTGERNTVTDGTPLQGLRIAHVRIIFKLPHHYPVHSPHPLAYIEWFTPLHRFDEDAGLFTVTRSTRMQQPYGEIITVDRIVRSCHLIPKFGREIDSRWKADNVTELCKSYYVNPYFDTHTFCMLRAQQPGCI